MTHANSQNSVVRRPAAWPGTYRGTFLGVASGALMILGIAFELAGLGYLRLHVASPWPLSVLLSAARNAVRLSLQQSIAPAWLTLVPLGLVGAGVCAAILLPKSRFIAS